MQRVIIVDDTDDIRELMTTVIETRSDNRFTVVGTASDGAEGIELAGRTLPDIVLLDIAMPIMDGIQALPQIRAVAPHALVVMVSGFPLDVGARQSREAGAHGYIEKNRLARTLVPQLQSIIDRERADRETDGPE